MEADRTYLERAQEPITEMVASGEGPVASVSCERAEGDGPSGALCEVVFVDGRTAECVIDVDERRCAYFVGTLPEASET
jgi:hypothetical protein